MNALAEIINSQTKFQSFMGYDFKKMTLKEKAEYIKSNMLWTIDELSEMLHEIPFAKTWSKKYDSWSEEKIADQLQLSKEEYIDAFHFFINVGLGLGLTEEEILKEYRKKNEINYERQFTNY